MTPSRISSSPLYWLLQKLNDYIKVNGKDDGGDYFLGSRYSYAEVLTTPFLRRAAVILPHLKDYSPLEATDRLGLDRLGRWYKVRAHVLCATLQHCHKKGRCRSTLYIPEAMSSNASIITITPVICSRTTDHKSAATLRLPAT